MKDLKKLFGTDGIRGIANKDLTAELALKVGRACAKFLVKRNNNNGRGKIIIGRDPRPSGDFLQGAIVAGILSEGVDVYYAGIITTPAVALLIKILDLDGGIVVSASHNPLEDNGIKFFAKGGQKLMDSQEKDIEEFILNAESGNNENTYPIGLNVGRLINLDNACDIYMDYVISNFNLNLGSLKIALDCANGAAGVTAPLILGKLGAEVLSFNTEITGENINKNCGSTHPEHLQNLVLENKADIGFSYDGDGDRVIACDSKGRIIDGDTVIAFCAIDLLKKGILKNDCVVTTVMANIGFDKIMESEGIKVYKTNVGDRYVLEKMLEVDCMLGGEQSGHIIFRNISPTGDGVLSTLEFLNAILNNRYDIESIYNIVPKYPQLIRNIKVKNKESILENSEIKLIIARVEDKLKGVGRILVRPSGTEPLIRVMVEAETQELAEKSVEEVIKSIAKSDR